MFLFTAAASLVPALVLPFGPGDQECCRRVVVVLDRCTSIVSGGKVPDATREERLTLLVSAVPTCWIRSVCLWCIRGVVDDMHARHVRVARRQAWLWPWHGGWACRRPLLGCCFPVFFCSVGGGGSVLLPLCVLGPEFDVIQVPCWGTGSRWMRKVARLAGMA